MFSVGICVCDTDDTMSKKHTRLLTTFEGSPNRELKLVVKKIEKASSFLFYSYDEKFLKKPIYTENENFQNIIIGYAKDRFTDKVITNNYDARFDLDGSLLEGEFVVINVNKLTGEVKISNDRFASVPFFITKQSSNIIATSNIHLLKKISRESITYNDLGLFQILKYGHTLGTTTTYSGIDKLFPATAITINEGLNIRSAQYWKLQFKPNYKIKLNDYSHEVFETFKSSVKWREQAFSDYPQLSIALSGGLDSRLLAGSMTPSNKLFAYTMGNKDDKDVLVARDIANILNIKHDTFEIGKTALHELINEILLENGGQCLHYAIATNCAAYKFLGVGSHVIFGGWPGDVLIGSYVPSDRDYTLPKKRKQLLKDFRNSRGNSYETLNIILNSKKLKELEYINSKYMKDCLESFDGPTAAHDITAWAMIYRQPSFSFLSPSHSNTNISEVTPCLGYEYNDLLLHLPAELMFNKNFYKYMIYNKFPNLQNVLYANTGKLLTGGIVSSDTYSKSYYEKKIIALKKHIKKNIPTSLLLHIKNKKMIPSPYWEFVNDKTLIRENQEDLNTSYIGQYLLDLNKTESFFKSFSSGDLTNNSMTNLAGSLSTILTEESFLVRDE